MSQVLIDTELVHGSALQVAAAQNGVGATWKTLASALTISRGMAGNPDKDQAAAKFAAAYTPAVRAVWRGFATMHRLTGYMSRGLTQTANNHARADHASMINGRFSMVPRPRGIFLDEAPSFQVSGPLNVPPPPSVTGPGQTPPHSLLGSLTGIELFDISKYWPTADALLLERAAVAWHDAHGALIEIRSRLAAEVAKVTGQGDAPDLEAFGGFWSRLYTSGAANTLYDGLPRLCVGLSKACGDYGNAARSAQVQVSDTAPNPIAALIEVAALRAALAQAAGTLLKAVSVIAVGALAEHLVTSVTVGVVNAPNVRILEAATEGDDFDEVLREWNDPTSEAPDAEDLESKVRKIASELGYTQKEIDEAIHAVKGHSDWRGLGGNRNPDVAVDLRTGEVYPKTKDGVGESSLGNILDYLPEQE